MLGLKSFHAIWHVIWHDFDVDVFWKEFGDKKCKWDQRSCHLYEGDRDADLAFDTHDTLYTVHTVHCTHGYTVHILRTAFKKKCCMYNWKDEHNKHFFGLSPGLCDKKGD